VILAGDRAATLNAFSSAAAYYDRALLLLPHDDPRRPQVLFGWARALFASGDEKRADALEQARTALLAAGEVEGAAEADALLADVAWFEGRRSLSDEHLQRAIALIQNRAATPAKAHVLSAVARFRMLAEEDNEAIEVAEQALALTNALHLDELRAHTLISVGTARWRIGDRRGAADVERGLGLALERNALSAAGRGYANLALIAWSEGAPGRGLELLDQAEHIAHRLGDLQSARYIGAQIADERYSRGEWEEALRFIDEFLADCETGSRHLQESPMRILRARICLARDDEVGAGEEVEKALSLARTASVPEGWLIPNVMGAAEIYLELGRTEQAHVLVGEVLSYDHPPVQYVGAALASHADRLGLRKSDLLPILTRAPAENAWRQIAEHLLTDFARAADFLSELGWSALEADARRRAAEKLVPAGRYREANEQLEKALAFYRSVGATRYIREAEALLATIQSGSQTSAAQPRA
jgi:tetratricopeptide (TPR) repeat protein